MPDFESNLRTLDIDFLVRNLRRPVPQANIAALAREAGYIVEQDILTETTKIYTPGFMEIEFLILQQGAGDTQTLKTNLGVNAQALRHLSVLKEFTITVHLFDMDIHIPQPEAYVLHKIAINEQRNKKAEKDRAAVLNLLPHLERTAFMRVYEYMTKKEQAAVRDFLEQNNGLDFLS